MNKFNLIFEKWELDDKTQGKATKIFINLFKIPFHQIRSKLKKVKIRLKLLLQGSMMKSLTELSKTYPKI